MNTVVKSPTGVTRTGIAYFIVGVIVPVLALAAQGQLPEGFHADVPPSPRLPAIVA